MKKKKSRKLKIGALISILLFILIIVIILYYLWKTPIKKITIEGNNYLKDNYLINYLDIEDKSIFKVSSKSIKDKLLKLELVSDVEVNKNYFGYLNIKIDEDYPLFYDKNVDKVVLSSGKKVDNNSSFYGLPTLMNNCDKEIYNELIEKLVRVRKDILILVSEIEYSPSVISEKIIDDKRFVFKMNDGNTVYINTINIEKINSYDEIYEAVMSKSSLVTGCLYLDSNSKNKHFGACE